MHALTVTVLRASVMLRLVPARKRSVATCLPLSAVKIAGGDLAMRDGRILSVRKVRRKDAAIIRAVTWTSHGESVHPRAVSVIGAIPK